VREQSSGELLQAIRAGEVLEGCCVAVLVVVVVDLSCGLERMPGISSDRKAVHARSGNRTMMRPGMDAVSPGDAMLLSQQARGLSAIGDGMGRNTGAPMILESDGNTRSQLRP
jgi:hypothetical protein